MIRPLLLLPLLALFLPAVAQTPGRADVPLETFVQQVTHLWGEGDVGGLMELTAGGGRLVLDTGSGTEAVNDRHAAAALRALFAERESVAARPVRVTVAGGTPPRGFAEVAWTFRTRGVPEPQSRSIYVGAIREDGGWRLTELRVLP